MTLKENIIKIATGSTLGQLLLLGSTPLLTRLFSPDQFGSLSLFSSAYAILICLSTFKYDLAIILPKGKALARSISTLVISLNFTVSILILVVWVSLYIILDLKEYWYFVFLPPALIAGSVFTIGQQWQARFRNYSRYAKSKVLNSIVNLTVSIIIGVAMCNLSGSLVIGFVCGSTVSAIYLSWYYLKKRIMLSMNEVNLKSLKNVALEYRNFPLYVLPSTLISIAGLNLIPFVVNSYFTLEDVGFYSIAYRFLLVPAAFIGAAITEAFRAEFVNIQRLDKSTENLFLKTLKNLLFIVVPVFTIVFFIAPFGFEILLGDEYRRSGILARYLCLGIALQFISQPVSYVFIATNNEKKGLLIQFLVSIVPLIGLLFGALINDLEFALLLFSILTAITSVCQIFLAYRTREVYDVRLS